MSWKTTIFIVILSIPIIATYISKKTWNGIWFLLGLAIFIIALVLYNKKYDKS